MPYTVQITRDNPTLFIFLVDQSLSMGKPFPQLAEAQNLANKL